MHLCRSSELVAFPEAPIATASSDVIYQEASFFIKGHTKIRPLQFLSTNYFF